MPLETTGPTPGEVSRLQTELYETKQALAEALATKTKTMKTEALDAALAGRQLAPGAREQLGRLLDSEIQIRADETGTPRAFGPNLTPLATHLEATLSKPEFAKFVAGNAGPTLPIQRGVNEPMGDFLARQHQATTPRTDPRLDMSRGFALGRGPTTPFAQQRDDGRVRR